LRIRWTATVSNFKKLKEAGVSCVHNNLETSERNFPNACITYTYQNKISTLRTAQRAGFSVCCGGIVGLGESMENRIDMFLSIGELNVQSVPVNLLNPIPGTPYAHNKILTNDEMCRIIAIARFLLPKASIRMAGVVDYYPIMASNAFYRAPTRPFLEIY
jgi:biotin synthase